MEDNGIFDYIMKIFVLLLDLNLIENVWVFMKQYFFNVYKLRIRDELVGGIKVFWVFLIVVQCGRYIDYIY